MNDVLNTAPPMPAAAAHRDNRKLVLAGIALGAIVALLAGGVLAYQGKAHALAQTQAQLHSAHVATQTAVDGQQATQTELDSANSQLGSCSSAVTSMKRIILLEANSAQLMMKAVNASIFLRAAYVHEATAPMQQAAHMAGSARSYADACLSSGGGAA